MKGIILKNNNLLSEEQIRTLINDSLYEKDLINEGLHEKCGKPKHISALPHDLRTNDTEKLQARKEAIIDKWKEVNNEIGAKNYPEEFWDIAQATTSDEVQVVSERVVEHYDNLLNTHKDLNTFIRESYQQKIDEINSGIEDFQGSYDAQRATLGELNERNIKLKEELPKLEQRFNELNEEYNIAFDLAEKIEEHANVLTNIAEANNLNYDDMINMAPNELNRISPGLRNYIEETVKIQDEYSSHRHYTDVYDDLYRAENEYIDTQKEYSENLSKYNRTVFNMKREKQEITYLKERKRYLKEKMPNKGRDNSEAYQELVNKKNLAIEFNNDCKKARDFQNELVAVNRKLGIGSEDGYDDINGLPEGRFGYIDVY